MNIKEQENQLGINLDLRILINIIAYSLFFAFVAYRIYSVSQVGSVGVVLGVAVPKLKLNNFKALSASLKATESGRVVSPILRAEPFD